MHALSSCGRHSSTDGDRSHQQPAVASSTTTFVVIERPTSTADDLDDSEQLLVAAAAAAAVNQSPLSDCDEVTLQQATTPAISTTT